MFGSSTARRRARVTTSSGCCAARSAARGTRRSSTDTIWCWTCSSGTCGRCEGWRCSACLAPWRQHQPMAVRHQPMAVCRMRIRDVRPPRVISARKIHQAGISNPSQPTGQPMATKKTRIDVHIDVQALRQPAWVSHYLVDLIRTRRIHVCKKLSWPSRFIVDKSDQADYDKLAPYHKRQRINALGTEMFEPCTLNQELWRRLGVSVLSLSKNLRPGATAR